MSQGGQYHCRSTSDKEAEIAVLLQQKAVIDDALRLAAVGLYDNAQKQVVNIVELNALAFQAGRIGGPSRDVPLSMLGASVAVIKHLAEAQKALESGRPEVATESFHAIRALYEALHPDKLESLERIVRNVDGSLEVAAGDRTGDNKRSVAGAVDVAAYEAIARLAPLARRRAFSAAASEILEVEYEAYRKTIEGFELLEQQRTQGDAHRRLILAKGENTRQLAARGVRTADALGSAPNPALSADACYNLFRLCSTSCTVAPDSDPYISDAVCITECSVSSDLCAGKHRPPRT